MLKKPRDGTALVIASAPLHATSCTSLGWKHASSGCGGGDGGAGGGGGGGVGGERGSGGGRGGGGEGVHAGEWMKVV